MSLFNELKRRNVIKVTIAYAIAAWLLIQITATTFPVLGIPSWAVSLVTALILIGFPLALIFAWAFELTPDGIKPEKDLKDSKSFSNLTGRKLDFVIIGMLVVTVVYLLFRQPGINTEQATAAPSSSEVSEPAIAAQGWENSIAVLPFVNMSSDPEQEYFSDGLSEELLNLLAKIPSLKVIGRTSSFAFKGTSEDLRAIGKTLDVKTLLEGSVRKSGDHLRITAQLVNASDGAHIWSETYDRTMTDIFEVQDDVSAAIFKALQIHVGVAPKRGRPTENLEAYTLFLKAKDALSKLDWGATALLLEAVEHDPEFAEAWEMLAFNYWSQAGGPINAIEAQNLVREASANAVSLNPDLSFAKVFYRSTQLGRDYRSGTIEALEQALEKEPDNPRILEPLVFLLTETGYLEEALVLSRRFLEIEPLSALAQTYWTLANYASGQTSLALNAKETYFKTSEYFTVYTSAVVGVEIVEMRDEEAINRIESYLSRAGFIDSGWVRDLFIASRDPVGGQHYLERNVPLIGLQLVEDKLYSWNDELLNFYLFFGFIDRWYDLLLETEPTSETWHYAGIHIWRGVIFHRLGVTAHPDFLRVAKLLNIDQVWDTRGPPDLCDKVDNQWVCE